MRRRINETSGREAVTEVLAAVRTDGVAHLQRDTLATAVRFLLEELGSQQPGNTLEVRVPPFGAVQCLQGPRHTRGTPPNVIEIDPLVWVRLATGEKTWQDSVATGGVSASGTRASLDGIVPILSEGTG